MRKEKKELANKLLIETLKKRRLYEEKDGKPVLHEEDIYPDYRDEISDKSALEILRAEDPETALEEWLESVYDHYIWSSYSEIINSAMKGVYPGDAQEEGELREYLQEELYGLLAYNPPRDHYLDQEIRANLMIDTGDANFDYGCNSPYPHYYGVKGGGIEKESALVWLAGTQGYSRRELEKALNEGDLADPKGFLESVRQEVANETSSMNCLTFLVKMPLRELIRLNRLIRLQEPDGEKIYTATARPDCGTLRISKNATCGMYDPWNGAGSCFEIELEKDIRLPIRFIRSCLPDCNFRWSVDSVYGMMDGAWKASVSNIEGPTAAEAA